MERSIAILSISEASFWCAFHGEPGIRFADRVNDFELKVTKMRCLQSSLRGLELYPLRQAIRKRFFVQEKICLQSKITVCIVCPTFWEALDGENDE